MQVSAEIEQLSEADCMRLLATVRVGRVALTRQALPVVLPVSFAIDGTELVLRTDPGSVLATSSDGSVVAFEAGEQDPDTGAGWSVLVTGTIHEITGSRSVDRAEALRPTSWAGDQRHHFVRVAPGLVSGSRPRPAT